MDANHHVGDPAAPDGIEPAQAAHHEPAPVLPALPPNGADRLASARGLIIGLAIGLAFWVGLAVAYALWRF